MQLLRRASRPRPTLGAHPGGDADGPRERESSSPSPGILPGPGLARGPSPSPVRGPSIDDDLGHPLSSEVVTCPACSVRGRPGKPVRRTDSPSDVLGSPLGRHAPVSSTPGKRTSLRPAVATRPITFRPRGFPPPRRFAPRRSRERVAARSQQGFTSTRRPPADESACDRCASAHTLGTLSTASLVDAMITQPLSTGPHRTARAARAPLHRSGSAPWVALRRHLDNVHCVFQQSPERPCRHRQCPSHGRRLCRSCPERHPEATVAGSGSGLCALRTPAPTGRRSRESNVPSSPASSARFVHHLLPAWRCLSGHPRRALSPERGSAESSSPRERVNRGRRDHSRRSEPRLHWACPGTADESTLPGTSGHRPKPEALRAARGRTAPPKRHPEVHADHRRRSDPEGPPHRRHRSVPRAGGTIRPPHRSAAATSSHCVLHTVTAPSVMPVPPTGRRPPSHDPPKRAVVVRT